MSRPSLLEAQPTPTTVRENAIPTFVAPMEAGAQADARTARRVFRLDPGLRRDDNVVESRQTQSARLLAILRANRCVSDFPRTVVSPTPG